MEGLENYINLDEIKLIKLCNELAQLTYKLKQNKHVECIYFAPYKDLGSIDGNVLNITVVLDTDIPDDLDKQYQQTISRKNQLNQFGIKIYINKSHKNGYTLFPINPSELKKSNDIFNSVILFDRTGEYSKIKEQTQKIGLGEHSNLFYYENLVEFIPPINDKLDYAMNKCK